MGTLALWVTLTTDLLASQGFSLTEKRGFPWLSSG